MKSFLCSMILITGFGLDNVSQNPLRADTFVILARNLDGTAISEIEDVQVRAFRMNQGATSIPSGPPFDLSLNATNQILINVTKVPNLENELQLTFTIDSNSPAIAGDEGSNRTVLFEFRRDGITTAVVPFAVVSNDNTNVVNRVALAIPIFAAAAPASTTACHQSCSPTRRLFGCWRRHR